MTTAITILVFIIVFFVSYVKAIADKARKAQGMSPVSDDNDSPYGGFGFPYGGSPMPDEGYPPQSRQDDAAGSYSPEYFTYETLDSSQEVQQPKPKRKSKKHRPVQQPVENPAFDDRPSDDNGFQFDLRQAVIAQTILHNDYIDDLYTR